MRILLSCLMIILIPINAAAQTQLPGCLLGTIAHNCFGTRGYSGGNKYVGEFKDGRFDGQGILKFTAGGSYVGAFVNDKFDGQGVLTYPDGDKFIGQFKDGMFNGQGTYTHHNGDKFIGDFKDDKRNGQGIEYSPSGSVTRQGLWENGNLVQSSALDSQSFTLNSSPFPAAPRAQGTDPVKAETDRTSTELQAAQDKCKDLGFKPKTEGFGKCVLQLSK